MRNRTHTTCTVLRHNDRFCDAPSAEDVPFPICARHAAKLYRHIRAAMGPLAEDKLFALWHNVDAIGKERAKRERAEQDKEHRVYYLQLGEHIKIGYTSDLKRRMQDYPLNRRLLAYEPGGQDLELKRHQQFREYLALGREYFTPGAPLLDHVNGLRQQAGAPAIKSFMPTPAA